MTDDFVLAEDLQLEEVLQLSAQPRMSCAVCRQVMPSPEASWKPDGCDHIICLVCFSLCAPETCAAEPPRCPVAACQSLRKPATREVIDVDDGSLISIQVVDNGKGKKPRNHAMRQVIDVDDDSLISVQVVGNGKGKKPWNDGTRQVIDVDDGSFISFQVVDNGKGKKAWNDATREVIDVDDGSFISFQAVDNGRGKRPWNYAMQVQEPASSSRCATSTRGDTYCTICMETVPGGDAFSIPGCTHAFCVGCVGQYIAAKVEDNVVSIGCPDPGCKDGALHPEACRQVIPRQLFERWGAALCDSALGALKFYCPFKDCSALLVDDPDAGEATITDAECPHCRRMFCAQCKVPWHDGVDCAEFQRLGLDERGREDLLLRKVAQERKWQRCPKCKMYVEKVDGCVFIVCRCGHCFCYLCASPMVRGSNHQCKKCQRTW